MKFGSDEVMLQAWCIIGWGDTILESLASGVFMGRLVNLYTKGISFQFPGALHSGYV